MTVEFGRLIWTEQADTANAKDMAILPIVIAPDPRLKVKCEPVKRVDADTSKLMDDLLETMKEANGIGLAAPQVGILKRVIVVGAPRDEEDDDGDGRSTDPLRMADPEIVWASEETATRDEGCLSLPEHFAEVTRPAVIRVRYRDQDDQLREIEADGLAATCIQHEMDHLDGVLFVDHISALRRRIILRKLVKSKRQNGAAAAAV